MIVDPQSSGGKVENFIRLWRREDDDAGIDYAVSLPSGSDFAQSKASVPRPPLPVPLLPNSACYSHSCYQNWKFPSLSGVDSFLMYAGFCRRSRYKPRSSLARSADYPFTHPPARSLLGCRASPSSHPISRSPPSVCPSVRPPFPFPSSTPRPV